MNIFLDILFALFTFGFLASLPHVIDYMNRKEEEYRKDDYK